MGHKLQPKARKCVLLGFADEQRGYRLLNVATKKIIYCKDVVFYEDLFPALKAKLVLDSGLESSGDARISAKTKDGPHALRLSNSLLIPDLSMKLISIPKLDDHGYEITFLRGKVNVRDPRTDVVIATAMVENSVRMSRPCLKFAGDLGLFVCQLQFVELLWTFVGERLKMEVGAEQLNADTLRRLHSVEYEELNSLLQHYTSSLGFAFLNCEGVSVVTSALAGAFFCFLAITFEDDSILVSLDPVFLVSFASFVFAQSKSASFCGFFGSLRALSGLADILIKSLYNRLHVHTCLYCISKNHLRARFSCTEFGFQKFRFSKSDEYFDFQ